MLPADLGYYDLRVPEVRAAQADLARQYGVTAFCYWHYWFDGLEVLQRPLREVVRSGEPDFPFCVGWANPSWTGVWHGAPDRTLIEQTYPGVEDHRRHFDSLVETFADPRYLRVDRRPLFLVFDLWDIPDVEAVVDLWRDLAERAGLGGLFVVGLSESWHKVPQDLGFDGSVATRLPTGRTVLSTGPDGSPTTRRSTRASRHSRGTTTFRAYSLASTTHRASGATASSCTGHSDTVPRARLVRCGKAAHAGARAPIALGEVVERVGRGQHARARPRLRPRLSRGAA